MACLQIDRVAYTALEPTAVPGIMTWPTAVLLGLPLWIGFPVILLLAKLVSAEELEQRVQSLLRHSEAAAKYAEQVAFYEARQAGFGRRYHVAFRAAITAICAAPDHGSS